MKKVFIFFGVALGLASCVNPINKLEDPVAEYEIVVRRAGTDIVSPSYVEVGENILFRTTDAAEADKFVVFTGDGKNNYNDGQGKGQSMNETNNGFELSYTYELNGSFETVLLATTYNKFVEDKDKNISRVDSRQSLKVIDKTAAFTNFKIDSYKDKRFATIDESGSEPYLVFSGSAPKKPIRVIYSAGNATVKVKEELVSSYEYPPQEPGGSTVSYDKIVEGDMAILNSGDYMIDFSGTSEIIFYVEAADPDPGTKEKLKKEYIVRFE